MKKFIIAALIVVSFTTSSFASTNEKVSSKALAHLEANYSGAKDIFWTVGDNFQKASFTLDNEKMDAYYDEYGFLIGTSKRMAFDRLPKSALDILTTQYTFPEYQLTDCIEFTDADNNKQYYISFDVHNESMVVSISPSGIVTVI